MKHLIFILAVWLGLTPGFLFATPATLAALTAESDANVSLLISAESRCVQTSGIPIEEVADNQVKWACLQDATVQRTCNPDGSHARVNAFRDWTSQVMDFKERCTDVGGTFAYVDRNFKEPADSSFCGLAQPEVMYSEWETPLCNFVSRCPQVAVTCIRNEDVVQETLRTVQLPGIPNAIAIAH